MTSSERPFASLSAQASNARATVLVIACIVLIASFRVARATFLLELPNFSPMAALAFCGGLLLPGALAWELPLAVLFLSDLALSLMLEFPLFSVAQASVWISLIAVVGLGRILAHQKTFGLVKFFGMLLGGSVLFYLATNTLSWAINPAYPRDLHGLWMSLKMGLPGFPPTWTFSRNSLISDVIFASLLLAVWVAARAGEPPRRVAVVAS
jgi:hypothetical protein